jgi:hypothetical protein
MIVLSVGGFQVKLPQTIQNCDQTGVTVLRGLKFEKFLWLLVDWQTKIVASLSYLLHTAPIRPGLVHHFKNETTMLHPPIALATPDQVQLAAVHHD